jgi:hypothetical protein
MSAGSLAMAESMAVCGKLLLAKIEVCGWNHALKCLDSRGTALSTSRKNRVSRLVESAFTGFSG